MGVDVALLIGSFPRKAGMERKVHWFCILHCYWTLDNDILSYHNSQELLQKNASIFTEQGKALSQFSSRDVKVLVVGNPANTNCLIAMACAPSIPRQNFRASHGWTITERRHRLRSGSISMHRM